MAAATLCLNTQTSLLKDLSHSIPFRAAAGRSRAVSEQSRSASAAGPSRSSPSGFHHPAEVFYEGVCRSAACKRRRSRSLSRSGEREPQLRGPPAGGDFKWPRRPQGPALGGGRQGSTQPPRHPRARGGSAAAPPRGPHRPASSSPASPQHPSRPPSLSAGPGLPAELGKGLSLTAPPESGHAGAGQGPSPPLTSRTARTSRSRRPRPPLPRARTVRGERAKSKRSAPPLRPRPRGGAGKCGAHALAPFP